VPSVFKAPSATSVILAAALVLLAMALGFHNIGLPPVIIVGGSGVVGLALWIRTYRHGPIDPATILPPFLLTVACLEGHMIEEYTMGFGPAMSRLFNISWSEHSFLLIFTFIGPILYALTALGLFLRVPIAGFLAWFIFVGPGVAEFTHFIFPMLQPSIQPHNLGVVTVAVKNGHIIADMPNYYFGLTGRYYHGPLHGSATDDPWDLRHCGVSARLAARGLFPRAISELGRYWSERTFAGPRNLKHSALPPCQ
jgi:hypothetical protein